MENIEKRSHNICAHGSRFGHCIRCRESIISHGGSSIVYGSGDGFVIKERVSEIAKPILREGFDGQHRIKMNALEATLDVEARERIQQELEAKVEKLTNNIRICEQYFGEHFLKVSLFLGPNVNDVPTLFARQQKLPEGAKLLDPHGWDFVMEDDGRDNLKHFLGCIERMFQETGLMVDLLALNNMAFDEVTQRFFIFDFDPLLCEKNRREELGTHYSVDSDIDNTFVTYLDRKESDAVLACLDNIELLNGLVAEMGQER